MLPAQQGYDRAITVFSPDGRLYQVEYAIETVRRGTIAVGVKCKDGIIMGTEKIVINKMMVPGTDKRLYSVSFNCGGVVNGVTPDGRSMI